MEILYLSLQLHSAHSLQEFHINQELIQNNIALIVYIAVIIYCSYYYLYCSFFMIFDSKQI